MKNSILLFGIFILLSSCNSIFYKKTPEIVLNKIFIDSVSIRAISIVNDSLVAFAGSNGVIGFVNEKGNVYLLPKVKYNENLLEFRSIATNNSKLFVLNVGNPALIYKIENELVTQVYFEENPKVFYDSMRFFDESNGIAMGDPTENCLSVLVTNNGGTSWKKLDCTNLPPIFEGEAAFAASNTNIAIYKNMAWLVSGGKKARIFKTSNLGDSWEVYNTPIIQGKPTTGIYSVDFYNDKHGIICGGDFTNKYGKSANKAITTDGGQTWKVVGENQIPNYVSCVQYVPDGKGKKIVAVSTNGIFYTNNFGKKWMQLSKEGFYAIKFISKKSAWLSGNNTLAILNFN